MKSFRQPKKAAAAWVGRVAGLLLGTATGPRARFYATYWHWQLRRYFLMGYCLWRLGVLELKELRDKFLFRHGK